MRQKGIAYWFKNTKDLQVLNNISPEYTKQKLELQGETEMFTHTRSFQKLPISIHTHHT